MLVIYLEDPYWPSFADYRYAYEKEVQAGEQNGSADLPQRVRMEILVRKTALTCFALENETVG